MLQVTTDWNPMQAKLKEIILKKDRFPETVALLKQMHSLVHTQSVYNTPQPTYMDEIIEGLNDHSFRTMPTVKDVTVAWNIWHITRIEDLTVNILISDAPQVLNDSRQQQLGTRVTDTGNAMTDDEIIRFSSEVDMQALIEYRNAVGAQTKQVIEALTFDDLKLKFGQARLSRILQEGGLTEHKDAIWLLDFWGKKNVAGLFQMPVTRHQIMHLNDCVKLKAKCKKLI